MYQLIDERNSTVHGTAFYTGQTVGVEEAAVPLASFLSTPFR